MSSSGADKRKTEDTIEIISEQSRRRGAAPFQALYRAPWWLILLLLIMLLIIHLINTDEKYNLIYQQLREGIGLTIYLAFASYGLAIVIGLVVGLIRAEPPQAPERGSSLGVILKRILRTIIYNIATLYVEVMRGIPTLVFLLIAGFIIVPAVRDSINMELLPILRIALNNPEIPDLVWRGRDTATAIAGLSLVYGAFLAEVFRAGIQSIAKGQVEAARSLGMSYLQVMRYIVIPQAFRRVLPPLGNDFVAMIKDTSLVTILGTTEITQIARRWSGSTFQYLETYLLLTVIYLVMTTTGSLLVQAMEKYLKQDER